MKNYSIIIPVYNERNTIPTLLDKLYPYAENNQEVIIVNDGSTDGSYSLLQKSKFITLINNNFNFGKGHAVRNGLKYASNDKIILFDGDLEMNPEEIYSLMVLNEETRVALGTRYKKINPTNSIWDFGNYFYTSLFNIIHESKIRDVLCCAKAFFKSDLNLTKLRSVGFDIDMEILKLLIKRQNYIKSVKLSYQRRSTSDGKKLTLFNSINIMRQLYT